MKRSGGFTLIEVLIALAVFGLLLAGLTQAVRYGLRAWETQVRIGDRVQDLDAVDRALRQMVAHMDPGDGMDPAPFTAGRNEVQFVTTLPDGGGVLPTRPITAALLMTPAHRLVLRWQPFLHAQPLRAGPAPTVTELVRGLAGLDLSYWRPGGGWITTWPYPDLPALIRIRLLFPPGDVRHWPDIVAAPLIDRP